MKSKKLLLLLLVLAWSWSSQMVTAQIVVYDDSDGPFTILAQMVTVLSPNGSTNRPTPLKADQICLSIMDGESWNGGEAHDITWSLDASVTGCSC